MRHSYGELLRVNILSLLLGFHSSPCKFYPTKPGLPVVVQCMLVSVFTQFLLCNTLHVHKIMASKHAVFIIYLFTITAYLLS